MGIGLLKKGVYLNSNSFAKTEMLNEKIRSLFTKEDSSIPRLQGEPHSAISSPIIQVAGMEKLLQ